MKPINFEYADSLDDAVKKELIKFYHNYDKLATCYRWRYIELRRRRMILTMLSLIFVTCGTIAGSVSYHPYVIGILSGVGIVLQAYLTKSKLGNNVVQSKFAYTSFEKVLVVLKMHLRGATYDKKVFLTDVKVLEDIIIDTCPVIDKMSKKFDMRYP